jgi:hypothetical protein
MAEQPNQLQQALAALPEADRDRLVDALEVIGIYLAALPPGPRVIQLQRVLDIIEAGPPPEAPQEAEAPPQQEAEAPQQQEAEAPQQQEVGPAVIEIPSDADTQSLSGDSDVMTASSPDDYHGNGAPDDFEPADF